MRCPYCDHEELRVTDSRIATDINGIRRRRECLQCSQRFTTFETVELTIEVHKRSGHYENFEQNKLISGMAAASRHTSVSHDQVMQIATTITGELLQRQIKTVTTTEIGELAMQALQKLDPIAYIRYACVYRRLKNIDELLETINSIPAKDDTLEERNARRPNVKREEVTSNGA